MHSSLTLTWIVAVAFTASAASAQDDEDLISCSVEATWLNCPEFVRIGSEGSNSVVLHLLGQVSSVPRNMCMPTDVHLTVTFMGPDESVLCVGTQQDIARINRQVQDLSIEVDPSVLGTFSRWLNQPNSRSDRPFTPLNCIAPNGRIQLLDSHLAEATTLSVTATLLPRTGGVGTAECRLGLRSIR